MQTLHAHLAWRKKVGGGLYFWARFTKPVEPIRLDRDPLQRTNRFWTLTGPSKLNPSVYRRFEPLRDSYTGCGGWPQRQRNWWIQPRHCHVSLRPVSNARFQWKTCVVAFRTFRGSETKLQGETKSSPRLQPQIWTEASISSCKWAFPPVYGRRSIDCSVSRVRPHTALVSKAFTCSMLVSYRISYHPRRRSLWSPWKPSLEPTPLRIHTKWFDETKDG
jgi:hypothetical protein